MRQRRRQKRAVITRRFVAASSQQPSQLKLEAGSLIKIEDTLSLVPWGRLISFNLFRPFSR